ncbi:MAG: type II secretion system F family protein, partial [Pseudomonadota bacterium]
MAAFEYTALDAGGRRKRGVISADSQKTARRELRKQSLTPLKVNPTNEKVGSSNNRRSRKLSSGQLVLVTRQLAMLVSAGSPIEEAVAAVGSGTKDETVRRTLANVRAGVVEGRALSDAMRTESKTFSPLYRAIVSAGETSGALGAVLDRLADNLEKSQAMQRKVTAALIYPAILAIVALSVVVALMVFVVPRVVEQFDTLGQDLPTLTNIMVGLSGFIRDYGLFIAAGIAAFILVVSRLMRTESFKRRVDGIVLDAPVIGGVARGAAAARFARTFATLAQSGAPVTDCLAASRETTPNLVLRDAVDDVSETVRKGGALSAAMA